MTRNRTLGLLVIFVSAACGRDSTPALEPITSPGLGASGASSQTAPAAPTPLAPQGGASVTVPFTISWSAVLDPSALNGGYNWQVSTSPTFQTVKIQDSTRPDETQATVSGLTAGTYYWRVNAVNASLEISAWSATRSVVITGAGAGAPGTPTLLPTQAYSTFHPREVIRFHWHRVSDAITYRLELSSNNTFPTSSSTFWFDNIPDTTYSFEWGVGEGNFFARVFAVAADNPTGVRSQPSNVIQFSVFYNNPIGPAPVLTGPADGATVTLPFNLEWAHVPNPQPSGYEVQVSPTSGFSTNETQLCFQLTEPRCVIKSLTAGKKFWRVRSAQGMRSPDLPALTAWSAPRTFTLSTTAVTPVSITAVRSPLYNGDDSFVEVQLSAGAPSGGATVTLASSQPSIAPVPGSISFPAGSALNQFQMLTGEVSTPTTVTLTATLNGVSKSSAFTLQPSSLKSLTTPWPQLTGGTTISAVLMLNGIAPAEGANVSLTSSSSAVTVPSNLQIAAGGRSAVITVLTNEVASTTSAVLTATWRGGAVDMPLTLQPSPPPTGLSLTSSTLVGGSGSAAGRPTIGVRAGFDQSLRVTSNNPAILPTLPSTVIIPAGSDIGAFAIEPVAVSTTMVVTISVTGGGVTRSANLSVTPPQQQTTPPAAPSLVSPGNDARFSARQTITFDWSDVAGAASYTIQIDDSDRFPSPLVLTQTLTSSQFASSALPTKRLWWRVRANSTSGTPGPWSSVRRFELR